MSTRHFIVRPQHRGSGACLFFLAVLGLMSINTILNGSRITPDSRLANLFDSKAEERVFTKPVGIGNSKIDNFDDGVDEEDDDEEDDEKGDNVENDAKEGDAEEDDDKEDDSEDTEEIGEEKARMFRGKDGHSASNPTPGHESALRTLHVKHPQFEKRLRVFHILPTFRYLNPKEAKEKFNISLVLLPDPPSRVVRLDLHPYPHVFVTSDDYAELLAEYLESNEHSMNNIVDWPSNPLKLVKKLRNKLKFCRYLQAIGFGEYSPKCYESMEAVVKYPVVVKPQMSFGSDSIFIAKNFTSLNQTISERSADADPRKRLFVIQEYVISRRERTAFFVAYRGRMVRFICLDRTLRRPILRLSKNDKKDPPPPLPIEQCNFPLFKRIVEKMNYSGIGDFDFRLDRHTKMPKIHEINPRLPGTVVANATLLSDFVCAFQFKGRGQLSSDGCVEGPEVHLI